MKNEEQSEFSEAPIEHVTAEAGMTVGDLATEYGKAGIGAADISKAVDIYAEMLRDPAVDVFVGLAGAMVPIGMRQVVSDLIRDGYIDVLVTTGANLTHDAIEAIGGKHHHGRADHKTSHPASESAPSADSEREHDENLRTEGVDRIYNVYLPQEHFTLLETHLRENVFPVFDSQVTIQDLTEQLGVANAAVNDARDIHEGAGISAAAAEHDVPIYCPAIQDSVLGIQAWMYSQTSEFGLDALGDMTHLSDIAFEAEKAGALVVGGGVPKNYTLQTMLTIPGAYDYAVQLTMDPDATGGLSGATLNEARSWGKLEPGAQNVSVLGDASITLPLLVAATRDRLGE
jgi:deoxyhypusine synthase